MRLRRDRSPTLPEFSAAAGEPAPSRVVGVVTGGAGAGATFLAVNVAVWASECGVRTVLVDADPKLGSVAAHLALSEHRSFETLAHQATLRPVDSSLVGANLQTYRRLAVLAGRSEPEPQQEQAEVFDRVVAVLASEFDLVVCDIGSLDTAVAVARAERCHVLLWVAVPTPVGAGRLDRTINCDLCAPLRGKVGFAVVNQTGARLPPGAFGVLEGEYGLRVAGAVPSDRRACLGAESSATPAVFSRPLGPPLRSTAAFLLRQVLEHKAGRDPLAIAKAPGREELTQGFLTGG